MKTATILIVATTLAAALSVGTSPGAATAASVPKPAVLCPPAC